MKHTAYLLKTMVLMACVALPGCRKRIDPAAAETREMPEGRACPASGMISDNENGANKSNVVDGRGGYWYSFLDEKGSSITPTAGRLGGTFSMTGGGANGTKFAARFEGSLAQGEAGQVYAGAGVNFVDPKGQYDASKYGGISFWAKHGPGSTNKVRLKVPDVATDPDGKMCSACFNDFGIDLVLTPEWQQYVVPFSAMKQIKGWGSPHTSGIDKSKLYAVQFQVGDPGVKFDIWVDEIQFTGCQ
ncbi:MAG TPA: carbohydrate binding domain-containing protein [Polyangiaceae bacterium]|nr:carbohydrate binding domain-containing protein [Polyangiaceae bacterium]